MFKGRLESLRKKKGLSQAEISARVGIARTTYSGYENGAREPDHATLQKLADFFEVSIDYLLGRTNDPSIVSRSYQNEDAGKEAIAKEFYERFMRIPATEREAIENMINVLSKNREDKSND